MVIIQGKRLTIRQMKNKDAPALANVLSDPQVMHFSIRGVQDKDGIKQFIKQCKKSYSHGKLGQWTIICHQSRQLIGVCGLMPYTIEGEEIVHINYRLAQSHWGLGYANEAIKLCVKYGFEQLKLPQIYALIDAENRASIKAAINAGFIYHGQHDFMQHPVEVYLSLAGQ